METEASKTQTALAPPHAGSIRLQVAGGDLLLRGRFAQWQPLMISDAPTNESKATAQILFDVTSNRTGAAGAGDDDLFSFVATQVKQLAPHAYRVKGQLKAGGRARAVEAVLQSPAAHTPFFVMTFSLDREDFAGLWDTLEARVARPEQTELRPEAWLREPELAAA